MEGKCLLRGKNVGRRCPCPHSARSDVAWVRCPHHAGHGDCLVELPRARRSSFAGHAAGWTHRIPGHGGEGPPCVEGGFVASPKTLRQPAAYAAPTDTAASAGPELAPAGVGRCPPAGPTAPWRLPRLFGHASTSRRSRGGPCRASLCNLRRHGPRVDPAGTPGRLPRQSTGRYGGPGRASTAARAEAHFATSDAMGPVCPGRLPRQSTGR